MLEPENLGHSLLIEQHIHDVHPVRTLRLKGSRKRVAQILEPEAEIVACLLQSQNRTIGQARAANLCSLIKKRLKLPSKWLTLPVRSSSHPKNTVWSLLFRQLFDPDVRRDLYIKS